MRGDIFLRAFGACANSLKRDRVHDGADDCVQCRLGCIYGLFNLVANSVFLTNRVCFAQPFHFELKLNEQLEV